MPRRTPSQRRRRRSRRQAAKRRGPGVRIDPLKVAAIVDTNVLLDIVSCHDVIDGYDKDTPEAWFRLDRAAFGLRLAIFLHETRAITLSAGHEALALSKFLVPPRPPTLQSWFMHAFWGFTKPKLLRQWCSASEKIYGTGTRVDDALIELARRSKCPLISNEGLGVDGPNGNKRSIRAKAPKAGVEVLTSQEFCLRHRLSCRRWKLFLADFRRYGPEFYRGHEMHGDAQRALAGFFDYYQKLLRGTEPDAIEDRERRRLELTGITAAVTHPHDPGHPRPRQ